MWSLCCAYLGLLQMTLPCFEPNTKAHEQAIWMAERFLIKTLRYACSCRLLTMHGRSAGVRRIAMLIDSWLHCKRVRAKLLAKTLLANGSLPQSGIASIEYQELYNNIICCKSESIASSGRTWKKIYHLWPRIAFWRSLLSRSSQTMVHGQQLVARQLSENGSLGLNIWYNVFQ